MMPHFVECPLDVQGNDADFLAQVQGVVPPLAQDVLKVCSAVSWSKTKLSMGYEIVVVSNKNILCFSVLFEMRC